MKRREFVASGLVGLGAVAVAGTARAAAPAAASSSSAAANAPSQSPEEAELTAAFTAALAPIAVGTQLGDATVMSVRVDEHRSGELRLLGPSGAFRVDVCARDEAGAAASMASTRDYVLFVRNGGAGDKASMAAETEAVSSIASVLSANESSVSPVALVTKSEYWDDAYWAS